MSKNVNSPAILIVEDDAIALHSMRDYLSRAGFSVRTAANGWDALKRLKELSVDLVIAEQTICENDGCNLREKMMLNPATRDIPFFVVTAQDKVDTVVRALRSGVDDCISKPFDPVILVARVQATLERRRAYEEMVRVDPLTRLLNRRTFEKEVQEELSRVQRYKRNASMILIDVDDFTRVNEESGVSMGDLLLTCLAGVILTSVRVMDIAGRYRGETFFLFLPETDIDGAAILAARIQERMAAIADTVAGFKLTFSCGIVNAPEDGADLPTLAIRSEKCLQHAKERKRGAIIIWSRDITDHPKESGTKAEI
ncbi:MAG TPA: diguanylate cyclase [Candidatus Hydrogenedentes bacterium]|nr:diguanylate cyclase [Candidatus Hydrogenedentota bacterium]